jgi:hypothetical protein
MRRRETISIKNQLFSANLKVDPFSTIGCEFFLYTLCPAIAIAIACASDIDDIIIDVDLDHERAQLQLQVLRFLKSSYQIENFMNRGKQEIQLIKKK